MQNAQKVKFLVKDFFRKCEQICWCNQCKFFFFILNVNKIYAAKAAKIYKFCRINQILIKKCSYKSALASLVRDNVKKLYLGGTTDSCRVIEIHSAKYNNHNKIYSLMICLMTWRNGMTSFN